MRQFTLKGSCWACKASHTFSALKQAHKKSLQISSPPEGIIGACQKCSAISVGCPFCHQAQFLYPSKQQCIKCDRKFKSPKQAK